MIVVRNKIIPVKGFKCLNFCGILFVRSGSGELTDNDLMHERIHTAQMRELLFVGFYVIYLAEWFVRLLLPGDAYHSISFEREAYLNEKWAAYFSWCRPFSSFRFIFKKSIGS